MQTTENQTFEAPPKPSRARTQGGSRRPFGPLGRLALVSVMALTLIATFAPRASAVLIHPFLSEFGPDGTSSTEWANEGPARLAVDQLTHDVFVTREIAAIDSGRGIIYRFDSAGQPDAFTEGAKAGTNRLPTLNLYPGGAYPNHPPPIAIAPPGAPGGTAGDIYAVDRPWQPLEPEEEEDGTLKIFSPEGALLGSLDGSGNPNPEASKDLVGVATDPAGNVYLQYGSVYHPDHTDKYIPSGNPVSNADFDSESSFSLLPKVFVDPINEDFYTTTLDTKPKYHNGNAKQFDKEGNLLSTMTVPEQAWGVAADHDSGKVYVSNTQIFEHAGRIRVYGPGVVVEPPTATLDPVGSLDFKSASFTGTVNSGGAGEYQQTTYRFRCTPECPGLHEDREVPADGEDHEVSDATEGLEPETGYEVTLTAENHAGVAEDTQSFETPAKPSAEAPEVTISPVTIHTATTAHLSGAVNPRGEDELQQTTYRFEYSADGLVWKPAPEQGPIEGEGFQEVATDLEGLEPNTTYSMRLRAENTGGAVTSAQPDPSFTTDPAPPLVEITGATRVLAASARLNGRIDARNADTTYYFQWGEADCAFHPCASVPVSEDAEAGSGGTYVWVGRSVSGLSPSTLYHYRLLAEGPGGETVSGDATFTTAAAPAACPNQALRKGASANLPDCRAYEMVSPLDKNGGDIPATPTRARSASDGDAVSYAASVGFAGAEGVADAGAEYLGSRGPEGWSTQPITPPQAAPAFPHAFTGSTYVGSFSPNLDAGVFQGFASIPGVTTRNVEGVPNLYLATGMRSGYPSFTLLSDAAEPVPPVAWENSPHIHLAAASADFSHVLFESTDKLTPDAGEGRNLYEFTGGKVRLAAILPDSACGAPPCPAAESSVGALTSNGGGDLETGTYSELADPISADGSRVFFTAGAPLREWREIGGRDEGFAGSLYMREDGTRTVQVDASERTVPDPKGPGRSEFQMATPDGSVAYFLSKQELVDADTDGEVISLYRYDVEAPAGERLTLMPTGGIVPRHVVGISEDGSFVYLTSTAEDLYLIHAGEMRLVATRSAGAEPNLGEDGVFSLRFANAARVTPDGRHILFGSRADLTGYDPHNPDFESGTGNELLSCGECAELYLYSYDSGELKCASCDPSGAPPSFDATFMWAFNAGTTFFPSNAVYTNTPLSRDGRYAFFTSRDALVEADTNGKLDAYVYDSERGEVRLLSSGQCNCDSVFLTASPDGHDAFFTTRERLVRADSDELNDIYDARVNGGIAAQNALPPAECQGDACQSVPEPPQGTTPSSVSFRGAGNALPQGSNCPLSGRRLRAMVRRNRALRHRARALARRGRRLASSNPRAARLVRRRAQRLAAAAHRRAKRAQRLARRTKRCRRSNRRAGR